MKPIENRIRNNITSSQGVIHFDETGTHIVKKFQQIHVTSNEKLTYYEAHKKRGREATDYISILPNFTGTALHDDFKTYNKYTACDHALCNAHILRELNGIT